MKKQKIIKYTIGGLFLVSLITLFIPLIEIYKVKVSVADIIRIGFKSSDFLNGIGIMTTALEEYIAPYTWFFVLLMVLPCLEGAAIFLFSRPRVVSIMGIVGAVMNTIIAFLLLLKISNVLKAVNSALSLLGTATKLSFVPTILWIVIYGMILFLSVGLLLTPKIIPQKRNLTFQNDTYSMTHNTYPMAHDTYPMAPVNNVSDMNHNAIDFHGSIIGRSGTYNQKVFLLEKEKTAIFGSDERNCDVVIQDIEIQAKQCAVLYDEFYQEYRLLTEYKNSVFLKSGQPLGSNRTYSLPRGTVLYINNPKHIFELGYEKEMRELDSTVFVNEEMNHAEDELDVLFRELGKAYYEGGFEDPLPQLLPLFDKITSIKRKDEQLVIKRPIRESKQCGTCGEALGENARFCRKCGTSVDNTSNDEPLQKYCGNCGQKLGSDMAFCMKCGTPVS